MKSDACRCRSFSVAGRAAIILLLVGLLPTGQAQPVATGIDVLERDSFAALRGRRVGLITNPTGVTRDLRSTIDVLHAADGVELVALFGPEHGVRGEAHAGDHVADARDERTGLPLRSLYGPARRPSAGMLAGMDTLVFDIQDIGSRSYTYISTMAAAMDAAAEHGKRFVVLDRPNPLTGARIEGRPLDPKHRSFVGFLPIPYVHGMTVGELAGMINGEGWLSEGRRCDLQVIRMDGWHRAMWFDQTGLPWVPTSPHIPRSDVALFYAATGIMGELHVISEGVGYPLPFELCGRPGLDPTALAESLNGRKLPGVHFRPTYWRPYYLRFVGETCGGVQITFTDRDRAALTPIQFHVMDAVRKLEPDLALFGNGRDAMFDKVCGTDRVRGLLTEGAPLERVLALWDEGVEAFRAQRKPYLLYD